MCAFVYLRIGPDPSECTLGPTNVTPSIRGVNHVDYPSFPFQTRLAMSTHLYMNKGIKFLRSAPQLFSTSQTLWC